jgi:hypothetical protein
MTAQKTADLYSFASIDQHGPRMTISPIGSRQGSALWRQAAISGEVADTLIDPADSISVKPEIA